MLKEIETLSAFIGNTPLRGLKSDIVELYAKLEYYNFSGSSKDRPAYSMIYNGIKKGKINKDTVIIASSSGNLAIAVASICKKLCLKFIPVIDPNINHDYEALLNLMSYKVVKVSERDKTGGYLLTRINTVSEMCMKIKNSFCADQYNDPSNYRGYYGLGNEIMQSLPGLNYIFIAVSSSGAITGVSKTIKKQMPWIKIIGVDVEGSVIFGQPPKKRFISGIGASQVPSIMKNASIDDVVIVSQEDIIKGCFELLDEQIIFAGASSGAVYSASKTYFSKLSQHEKPSALIILPDKGYPYLDTIYNKEWSTGMCAKPNLPVLAEDIIL
ncbi:MAG: pyridoxal-phosphate dependent enzyme [Chitinophagaceae bacterium]